MYSGMWQTKSKIDFLCSSHKRFPTILSCGKQGITLWTGFVSRVRLCWRLWGSETNFRRSFVYFWKYNICSSQMDVQETDCFFTQSKESETISLHAGLRMDGSLALDLWDIVIEVLRSTNNIVQPNHNGIQETGSTLHSKTKTQSVERRQKVEQLSDVDYEPTNTHSSQGESRLYIFEDNEAVIIMTKKGTKFNDENPQSCSWLAVRRDEWNHLLRLFNIMSFSIFSCSHFSDFSGD